MSANEYFDKIQQRLQGLKENQLENINKAAASMAASLAAGRAVYYFGSGHSTLPTLDVFPRYGSFVGIQPIYDNRLLWSNVIGPGGTPELLWIERQEGYMSNVLRYYNLDSHDTMIVISHGGLNAAPIEAALIAKEHGLTVIVITSVENWKQVKPTHSSGKHLADTADIVIDNGAPLEELADHDPRLARARSCLRIGNRYLYFDGTHR